MKLVENEIKKGEVVGLDIAMFFGGLLDHILFVYGYDKSYFYVFDTRKVPLIQYEKITNDERFIMRISIDEVKKRWKRFSRVWEVKNSQLF